MVKPREDMTGWKMWEHGIPDSRIIIIKQVDDYINPASGQHIARWQYRCTCEKRTISEANGTDIKTGRVKSCGCITSEKVSQRMKKYCAEYAKKRRKTNTYDLTGEYGIGWTTNTNNEFYFDLNDYDLIKDYCWSELIDNKGYHSLISRDRTDGNKVVRMCWLLGCKGYDHIDRNPLNNQRNNLRPATSIENRQNSSMRSDNTSGVIGVHFDQRDGVWISDVCINYKRIRVYYGNSKNDAIKARLEAEAKYYGKFAPQRHLFEQYGITQQNDLNEIEPIENLTTEETYDDCI